MPVVDDLRLGPFAITGSGRPGPVEVAVDPGREDGFQTIVGDDDIERDQRREDLFFAPGLNRGKTAELATDVVDNGGVGEERDGTMSSMGRPSPSAFLTSLDDKAKRNAPAR